MFLLGLIAFLHSVFIPGFILLKYTGFVQPGNRLRFTLYAFGSSLLITYLMVFLFTALGIYTPLTVYIVFIVETLLIAYFHIKNRPVKPFSTTGSRGQYYINLQHPVLSFRRFSQKQWLWGNVLFIVAIGVILVHIFYFFYFLGSVFEHWDPAVGWNRFAIDWAANELPSNTWRYPQLIPSNWSFTYTAIGTTTVQAFARAIMPLFSMGTLLIFLDLGIRTRKSVYYLALILYGILLNAINEPSIIVSGYVDTAVAFFSFLAFYVLYSMPPGPPAPAAALPAVGLNPSEARSIGNSSHFTGDSRFFGSLRWAVLFASAAAVTKQAGIYILAVILVMSFWQLLKKRRKEGPFENFVTIPITKKLREIVFLLLIVIAVTGTWYGYKEVQIRSGLDSSEVPVVQAAHKQVDYFKRFSKGFRNMATQRHPKAKFIIYGIFLFALFGLFHKKSRAMTLAVAIPFTLLWGFLFSYDGRNLSLALPFIAFAAAFGAKKIDHWVIRNPKIEKGFPFNIPVIPLAGGLVVLLLLLNFMVLDNETILRQQTHRRQQIGNPQLNRLLYDFHEKEGIKGEIATSYFYIQCLPGLQEFFHKRARRITPDFLQFLETKQGEKIHYMLMPDIYKGEKEAYRLFWQKVKNRQYRLIFRLGVYRFVQVRNVDSKVDSNVDSNVDKKVNSNVKKNQNTVSPVKR